MSTASATVTLPADWRDFLALTKPRVMTLVVFTGLCGMLAAPVPIHPVLGFTAILCIALGAGAAGGPHQRDEAELVAKKKRTPKRPPPAGRVGRQSAPHRRGGRAGGPAVGGGFSVQLAGTVLRPRPAPRLLIGGAAGAFPPMIGWAAATGDVTLMPVLLFALIFLWTPPHFWALALFVKTDYANAGVPMLPVVAGERSTRIQIGLYTLPMILCAAAPWPLGFTGPIYGIVAAVMSGLFLAMAVQVAIRRSEPEDMMVPEKRLFKFSILYLFIVFGALVVDRWFT